MHGSGLKVTDDLKSEITKLKSSPSTLYIKIEIAKETFELKKSADSDSKLPTDQDFKTMAAALESGVACYMFFRDPMPKYEGKWVLCQYMPDTARVNSKMLYASSRAAMKTGFGNASCSEDYFISEQSELNLQTFLDSRATVDKTHLMTFEEQAKSEAVRGEILAMSDGVALTVSDAPITVSAAATQAITSVKEQKCNTAVLLLEPKSQELLADTKTVAKVNAAMEDVASVCLSQKEPRFVLHRYTHQHEGKDKEAMLFIYYCPDEAIPRMKMMYSTCKAMVLTVLEKMEIAVTNKFEASTEGELADRAVLDDLYPKKAEKMTFAKPKTKSKGKRRLISKKKFSAK
mmetsp:Transcript_14643/g.26356  ORF Transcript_14643/g.26356 Transcript_14643/m.26356 type:complete len:346 (-) Transcript_14643:70-1107(-)|eukprot:CAMPEP_0197525918 /NCGR_PEP_ID=MMETSP1318-20131121/15082_1 /TAXON_ID=552666 /ORGANISM="Partenskyella glossopodia, Strain RCC365" /LENGTH=345 /DNA_ID=CAMNT_0043079749 /DNA_START=41 /DNA_END=1078 /DNA_ORIENTATION=-